VVVAPSPVTSAADSGGGVVDTRSPKVEREEECASGWSIAGSGGNSMAGGSDFLLKQRKWREGGGCPARACAQGGGGPG
jgi:hypothetical protein